MKNIEHTIALSCFTRIFFWIFILFISSPSWAVSFRVENETYPVIEPAKATFKQKTIIKVTQQSTGGQIFILALKTWSSCRALSPMGWKLGQDSLLFNIQKPIPACPG